MASELSSRGKEGVEGRRTKPEKTGPGDAVFFITADRLIVSQNKKGRKYSPRPEQNRHARGDLQPQRHRPGVSAARYHRSGHREQNNRRGRRRDEDLRVRERRRLREGPHRLAERDDGQAVILLAGDETDHIEVGHGGDESGGDGEGGGGAATTTVGGRRRGRVAGMRRRRHRPARWIDREGPDGPDER